MGTCTSNCKYHMNNIPLNHANEIQETHPDILEVRLRKHSTSHVIHPCRCDNNQRQFQHLVWWVEGRSCQIHRFAHRFKAFMAGTQTVSSAAFLLMLSMRYAITPIRRTQLSLCLCSCSSQAKDCPRHSCHNPSLRFHRVNSNPFH